MLFWWSISQRISYQCLKATKHYRTARRSAFWVVSRCLNFCGVMGSNLITMLKSLHIATIWQQTAQSSAANPSMSAWGNPDGNSCSFKIITKTQSFFGFWCFRTESASGLSSIQRDLHQKNWTWTCLRTPEHPQRQHVRHSWDSWVEEIVGNAYPQIATSPCCSRNKTKPHKWTS